MGVATAKLKEKGSTPGGTYRILYHAGGKKVFKGRAEVIRLLLEDAGVPYEESDEGLYGPTGFCDAFKAMGSDSTGLSKDVAPLDAVLQDTAPYPVMFPPILHYKPAKGAKDQEVFINQVPAILRYIAGGVGYVPRGRAQQAQGDQLLENANDFLAEGRRSFHPVEDKKGYSEQKEEADKSSKEWAQARLPVWLGHFEKVVRRLCPAGDGPLFQSMSYADVALFFVLDAAEAQFNTDFYGRAWDSAPVPTLKAWKAWVAARPRIAAYQKSERCAPWAGDSMM